MAAKRGTATSNFGVGLRESHDASGFYGRFTPPEVSTDDTVLPREPVAEPFICGDARKMVDVADGSVALVVTSPPYFAGKQYEEELSRDGVPSSYLEYLELLRDVFAECVRTLEPGGRMAVNVANLGRKPYRSLSADVITIFQDLGLLLRGELIWQKAEGAGGSCAWGSFRSASNPVLRDLTERVIVASKGRFDRARTVKQRAAAGLPHENTMLTEDFMAHTLDVWSIPPESAKRVGHPAPFPVELPEQLIRLYTFRDDLVLDPFMGSGTTLMAAAGLDRRYIGYDTDPDYVALARQRVLEMDAVEPVGDPTLFDETAAATDLDMTAAARDGKGADKLAQEALKAAGFTITATNRLIPRTGVRISFEADDGNGDRWLFDVAGSHTSRRGGLARTDVVWRSLGRAHAVRERIDGTPLVLLTTNLPRPKSEGDTALRAAGPNAVFDVIDVLSADGRARLERYAQGGQNHVPLPGFWTPDDVDRRKAFG